MHLYLRNIFVYKGFSELTKILSVNSVIYVHEEEGVAKEKQASAVST